jgi:chaperonin cofactor prefoldin
MELTVILAAIQAVGTSIPEFVALIEQVKTAFDTTDQDVINAQLAASSALAKSEHEESQEEVKDRLESG